MSAEKQEVEIATTTSPQDISSTQHEEQRRVSVDESEKVVTVPTTGKRSGKLKQHFKEIFGTIWVKPEGKPPNMWKILTMLNNKQRLTFTAGKILTISFCYTIISLPKC